MTKEVNDYQVDGDHYNSTYQHWDLIVDLYDASYLIGCATKYVVRWRKKNGKQDLKKARHYVKKLLSLYDTKPFKLNIPFGPFQKFVGENDLSEGEKYILTCLFGFVDRSGLAEALYAIDLLMGEDLSEHGTSGR